MKIEIEFTSSNLATLTIDGKEMQVVSTLGRITLEGLECHEMEGTLGGIVAIDLYNKITQYQQAWASATDIDDDAGTWTALSEEAAQAAEEPLW